MGAGGGHVGLVQLTQMAAGTIQLLLLVLGVALEVLQERLVAAFQLD